MLSLVAALGLQIHAAQGVPDWGNGVAPFGFALIGDMPYGAAREVPFQRLVGEINRDNDVDFIMHAGDIKAGSEPCSDSLILHRFGMYQTFRRAFVYTPGDHEWTDCHRASNGAHNPLARLDLLRSVFFPEIGQTTGGKIRPVRSQAEGGAFSEFVENVMFRKQGVMFATVHVVGSNNDLEPWSGIDPADSCATPRAERIAEYERRLAAALAWLDQVFVEAADSKAVFVMIQANPDNVSTTAGCTASGFDEFMERLQTRSAEFGKPVMLAHGDDHFFFMDQPFTNKLFSRVQTYGEGLVHWVKVHVDPKSTGVFSVEQKIVRPNM
jgi:hypothetical protein